jgi:transcriptional regulator with PAS, ATPase and Fis domain
MVGTGVTLPEAGAFELADGGTILLEEIGAVPAGVQTKLLRLLQEGTFERVGGKQPVKSDVRILATTNRDLESKVRREEFREDLFLRLNIVPVAVPALRDREGDLAVWADHFRVACARRLGIDAPSISAAGWGALERHAWPGNLRELHQRIGIAVVAAAGAGLIEPAHLGFAIRAGSPAAAAPVDNGKEAVNALDEMEKRHIYTVLDRCQWNRGNAAELLGISIRTLRNKLKEYGANETSEPSQRQP